MELPEAQTEGAETSALVLMIRRQFLSALAWVDGSGGLDAATPLLPTSELRL